VNVIVWDLETVPDLRGFAAANELVGKSDAEIRAAMGEKFPKHIYHSIFCIGALVAHQEQGRWYVDVVGAPHVGEERTEKALITAFVDKIAELNPQLVTFNGNSFDLPVLRYRAMVNQVSAHGLAARPYFNRYTEDALDLCDALSSFSIQGKASLNEISRVMGLPGKPPSMSGSEVYQYYLDGNFKKIADYCETDIVNTYRIWLRYELFRGRLTHDAYDVSEQNLIEFVKARQNVKPHLKVLTAAS
jgi:predicted PolB exonuclease-like 3'-5' exonuclease